MAAPPAVPASNPYHEGSLIYELTTPPERTSKLAPRWEGPFRDCRTPNEYQVTYEDDGLERIIHINHAKPVKFTDPDFPEPVPPVEVPRPPLGYLPAGLARRPPKPRAPPVNHNEASMPPSAAPAVPIARPPVAAPANQRPEPAPPHRRSPRLNPEQGQAHAILSRPAALQHHSQPISCTANRSEMARIYPLTIGFTEAIGPKENPLSSASLRLVDLRNGQSRYLSTMKQLIDSLPKTEDPASRFVLRGHITHPGQPCLRHSVRAALWFLLLSDGTFLRDLSSLRYYLARQGRRALLRGGDVTRRPWENRLNWNPDPALSPSRDHGKKREEGEENRPPPSQSSKMPRKIRPRRRKREHRQHHLPGPNENAPGIDLRPREMRGMPVKHPQPPQLPQHPRPAANKNLSRVDPWNQADPGRLYKQAPRSRGIYQTISSRLLLRVISLLQL